MILSQDAKAGGATKSVIEFLRSGSLIEPPRDRPRSGPPGCGRMDATLMKSHRISGSPTVFGPGVLEAKL